MQLERSFEIYSSAAKKTHTQRPWRERRNYFLSWCSANEKNIYIMCGWNALYFLQMYAKVDSRCRSCKVKFVPSKRQYRERKLREFSIKKWWHNKRIFSELVWRNNLFTLCHLMWMYCRNNISVVYEKAPCILCTFADSTELRQHQRKSKSEIEWI